MKKISFFTLICAGVFSFAVSSCSSEDKEETVAGVNPDVFLVYTDYISDVNNEYGVVYKDYFDGHFYIDAANGNRYYLAATGEFLLAVQPQLEKAGILVEGNNVKFSGKVYAPDERWIPGLQWRLDNYGWNDGAKEAASYGLYNFELPTAGHAFWLVTPDFTIENAE